MHCRQSTYEKENYKNNVGCIIFMKTVYPVNMMESCLTCEKILNECEMFYEFLEKRFFENEKLEKYGKHMNKSRKRMKKLLYKI